MSIIDTVANAIIGLLARRASSEDKFSAGRDPVLESAPRQSRQTPWQYNQ